MKILVLAGTEDARKLCTELIKIFEVHVTASFRTSPTLANYPVSIRTGGFGGIDGLVDHIQSNSVDLLIDATHPFASSMKQNALHAAKLSGVEFIALNRKGWELSPKTDWITSTSIIEACKLIPKDSTIFAAIGGKNFLNQVDEIAEALSSSKVYLRVISPFNNSLPPNWNVVEYNSEISTKSELELFQHYGITCLLCRNSGSNSGLHKLKASFLLGIKVYMVNPMEIDYGNEPNIRVYSSIEEILHQRFKSI